MFVLEQFITAIYNTWSWVLQLIFFEVNWYENYFWGLIIISVAIWGLEILFPWRKNQSIIRKDFWLDGFYMFFNFFIFSVAISGFYELFGYVFQLIDLDFKKIAIIELSSLHIVWQMVIFFVTLDFVQWATHIALHRWNFLWQFHKVHHSVKEMGFAAHLRYHWMENIVYKPAKTIGVMLLGGFEPTQAYIVHFIAITIGHLNHSNIKITWGPLKYILNNPVMHLWHHAKDIPKNSYGVNFGISLSIWDYIFRTNYIPKEDGNIALGFNDDEKFPQDFVNQLFYGIKK